jgi:hypothetical protein
MTAINPLSSQHPSLITPAIRIIAITPADADLSHVCRMLYVGTGGTVVVRDLFGNVAQHENVASGTYLGPFQVDRVTAATSATGIVGYV